MKVYVGGKITGNPNFMEEFAEATAALQEKGHKVMNPAVLPAGFAHGEYMNVCYAMLAVCEAVYFLRNWEDSVGALMEYDYAKYLSKKVFYQKEGDLVG